MASRHTPLLWAILLFAPCFLLRISAQEEESVPAKDSIEVAVEASLPDSLVIDTAALHAIGDNLLKEIRPRRDLTTFKPEPIRALWLGLVIPGAGQIYNRKYWKLPIVYGGFLGCVYALTWNGQMYADYSQAHFKMKK